LIVTDAAIYPFQNLKETLMRIAQVAPLWECVPPPAYGGIELVVSLLTDELVRRGHEVTLFASGDSTTLAHLESVHPRALRLDDTVKEYGMYELLNLSRVFEQAGDFDIIHSHVGCAALPLAQVVNTPVLHTLHGVFTPDGRHMFHHARHQPYVSISQAQIEPELDLNIVSTVYNGIDVDQFNFYAQADQPQYLAFLGRMSPEKGPHHAIAIAKATGIPLRMAGKVDPVDRAFFEAEVLPHIDGEFIKFQGEANHAQKNELMGRAVATLFPITWREPFGLVMVEALAAGSPVVAMAMGSVPEIIAHGKVGFQCNTVEECVAAVQQIGTIDRAVCRQHVQTNFSAASMTTGYEAAYQKLIYPQSRLTGKRQLATV
jgi:glycosyltransferase involved in cell wall biosynthesis